MDEKMKHLLQIIKDLDTDGNGAEFNNILEKGKFEEFELKELIQKAKSSGDIYEPRPEYFKAFSYDIFEELEAEEDENNDKERNGNFKYQNADIAFLIQDFFMTACDIKSNGEIHSDGDDRVSKKPVEIKAVKYKVRNGESKNAYGTIIFYRRNHEELVKLNGDYLFVIYTYRDSKIYIHGFKLTPACEIDEKIENSSSKVKIGLRWPGFFENVSPIPLFSIYESELIKFTKKQRTWFSILNGFSVLPLRVCKRLGKWDYLSNTNYLVQHRTILHNEIVFDIDFKNWIDSEYYGRKVVETLKELGIPHILAYSGGKGIHIHIFFTLTEEQKDKLFWEQIDIETSFIRMEIFRYILEKTDIKEDLIGKSKPFDTSCVIFSDKLKGHLIRAFGGKKNSFKTLIVSIPTERPVIPYEKVIFPEGIEEWPISDEIFGIILQNYQTEKEVNNAN